MPTHPDNDPDTRAAETAKEAHRIRRLERLLAAAQESSVLDPHDMAARRQWLNCLHGLDRLDEAAGPLAVPPSVAGSESEADAIAFLFRSETLLRRAGRIEAAMAALDWALTLRPDDMGLLQRVVGHVEATTGSARARPYAERLRALMAASLPPRLDEGLRELWDAAGEEPLPQAAVAWAWELADRRAWSPDAWRRSLDWGARSRRLLRNWWASSPSFAEEIAGLINAPDLSPLRDPPGENLSRVMAGAHIGPTSAAVQVFQACGMNFRTVGGAAIDQPERTVLIPTTNNRSTTSRALVGEVKRGALVGFLADTASPTDSLRLHFLDHEVAVSTLAPRMALKYGCPTYWCAPLWRGDRITVELSRLPDPDAGEATDAWLERWSRAYLACLEPVMRGDPRNLDLNKGIWRAAGRPSAVEP